MIGKEINIMRFQKNYIVMAKIIFLICEWLYDSSCLHIQSRTVVSWFWPCNLCGIFRDNAATEIRNCFPLGCPAATRAWVFIISMLAILILHIYLYCWVHLGPGIIFINIYESLHFLWFEHVPHDAREPMITTLPAALPNYM